MLKLLDKKDFTYVYEIMEDSFPPDEIRSYENQLSLMDKDIYKIYVIEDENNKLIKAFIAVYEFEKFLFVEHFAVNKKYRNEGLGSAIIEELSHITGREIVLEVEPPRDDITKRRVGFYERNGFVLNNYPYIMPALSADKNDVELRLMYYSRELDREEFEEVKSCLYKNVYNVGVGDLSEKYKADFISCF